MTEERGTMRFAGQVAIITGAARGLGRRYAERFVADGGNVVLADLRDDVHEAAAEVAAGSRSAIGVQVDVNVPAAAQHMADSAIDAFGRIDVLVNNAGVWGDYEARPLLDVDLGYWDFVMGVNVRGPLICTRAVAPTMIDQGRGRVINVSSMGAYMVAGVYGVSKLALNQLTYALAKELGPAGITVNAVAPGPIDNEASRRQVPDAAFERLRDTTLVKRLGDADDVYGMIAYLAGEEASWVTAQTFLVNGGFNTRL
jgi:NAD(P)-dependent dehydrogenase (short-subunit alcohol dehydrogenase family)